jgi:phosphatidylglycerophosphate synthase
MGKPDLFVKGSKTIETLLKPAFVWMYKRGITANWLTFSQLILWPLMLYFFSHQNITIGMVLVLLTLLLDVLDGPFARSTGTASSFGYMADKITDLGGMIIFLTGLTLAFPNHPAPFGALIVALIVLYILNAKTEVEIWGGTRVFATVGYFINQLTIGIQISLTICILVILYDVGLLIKRRL